MKHYLSFGGGVNSVALYLLMRDMGVDFEAAFVDHGGDWPETYEYVKMFADKYPLTILRPDVEGVDSLYDYCIIKGMMPSRIKRWCTDKFKVRVMIEYYHRPCFVHLGIDAGEPHRARMSGVAGQENRYILIEEGINRDGCEQIIKDHGLPVPKKSGCWFCPFQRVGQWRKMRKEHPELWCKALGIERTVNEGRARRGKAPIYLYGKDKPLTVLINDKQAALPGMESMEYPPCQCGL